MAQTDPYANLVQRTPQVRTGAVGGPGATGYYAQGVSTPPGGGQVTDVNNPEPNDPYAGIVQTQGDSAAPPDARPVLHGLEDMGIGAAKGLLHTATELPAAAGAKLNNLLGYKQPESVTGRESLYKPQGTMQSVGHGIEQAGEFLVPGLGEEAATGRIAEAAPKLAPVARIGYNALTSGLVNKAQGGGFGTGAAAGGVAGAVGEGLKALAPHLAESALNIRKLDRAYGKGGGAIGRTILDETSGVRPGTVAESAQARLDELNPRLDAAASTGEAASLSPAQAVLLNAGIKAERQGERTTLGQLEPMMTHLSEDIQGNPLPETVPAPRLLDLKRGFGNEFIHRWNPETMQGVKGTAAKTYHALGEEFNNAVPDARGLNRRISLLIPVAKRGESAELNAPTAQRIAHRIAAHTGALTGGVFGAGAGYHEHGIPGAVAGGLLGIAAPEMLTSPTVEMTAARSLNGGSKLLPRLAAGSALQLERKPKDQ